MAAQHFARRTLSQKEWDSFVSAPCLTHDERLRFLATRYAGHGRHCPHRLYRWACKEAAFKATYPHIYLYAKDLSLLRDTGRKPSLVLTRERAYRDADGSCAIALANALRFHTSVSHDGDYVVASVVAETHV